MSWAKLSDDYGDDCWTLSDAAFRLHVDGLCWSNRKLLDLRIPKADLPRVSRRPEAAAELVAVGWWSDEGGAYTIRHHACYQRAAEDVLRQQEVNKANRAKGRTRPGREQVQPDESSDESSDRSSDERDRPGQDRLVVEETHYETFVDAQADDEQSVSSVADVRCYACKTSNPPGVAECGYCHNRIAGDGSPRLRAVSE